MTERLPHQLTEYLARMTSAYVSGDRERQLTTMTLLRAVIDRVFDNGLDVNGFTLNRTAGGEPIRIAMTLLVRNDADEILQVDRGDGGEPPWCYATSTEMPLDTGLAAARRWANAPVRPAGAVDVPLDIRLHRCGERSSGRSYLVTELILGYHAAQLETPSQKIRSTSLWGGRCELARRHPGYGEPLARLLMTTITSHRRPRPRVVARNEAATIRATRLRPLLYLVPTAAG